LGLKISVACQVVMQQYLNCTLSHSVFMYTVHIQEKSKFPDIVQ